MKHRLFVILSALLVFLSPVYSQNNQPMIDTNAPDFSLKDLKGNMITLSGLKGKFVVIHFAASW
jgi:cytochrome oxidase Cu insertion factor (SCO1/SenC/PrrC family)